MTEPSELRGDVISRKEAIEALEVVARGAEATAKMAEIVSDADMARMMNHTKSVVTATIELLSALPSVPEPPNDAERKTTLLKCWWPS